MKKAYQILATGCLFFTLTILTGQESLSLEQAVANGLRNNYQIQAADETVAIAANNNTWGAAGRLPSVNLSLNGQNAFSHSANPASFLREANFLSGGITPGADASITLFNGHRIRFVKEQLEQLENQSRQNVQVLAEQVVLSVAQAYYQVLIQQEQLQVLENVLKLSRDRIAYQEARKEFGRALTFDLLQTQDAYLNDSTRYLVQVNNVDNAFRNLNLAMGEDDLSRQYALTEPLETAIKTYNYEELQQRMESNNRNLQNLLISRELAQTNTRIQESAKAPVVNLRSNLSYSYNNTLAGNGVLADGVSREFGGISNTNFNAGLSLGVTYNLYNGQVRERTIDNARRQEIIAQLNIEDQKRRLHSQLANTLANYDNQKQLIELTSGLISNAEQNLQIAEERLRGGLITSFDYRTIQLNYINAAQTQLNAYFNLKTAELDLLRITGELVK